MENLNVILEYKRSKPVWVCSECDAENVFSNETCLFCRRRRSASDYVIEAWSAYQVEKTDEAQFFRPVEAHTANTIQSIQKTDGSGSSYFMWIILGAVSLFVVLVAAIIANI